MTTHQSRGRQHLASDHGELIGRQTKREKLALRLGFRRSSDFLARLLGSLFRRGLAHARTGHERTFITKNRPTLFDVLAITVLSLAFSAQPALAHDSPMILPTRLDFDASRAPKNCNDPEEFRYILGTWVQPTVLRDDAERRLVVRIRLSSTGGKQADVTLVDAQGAIVAEWHRDYPSKEECHKVLSRVANAAAKLLGAFEPPPPKEPLTCPVCPSFPSSSPPAPASASPTSSPPARPMPMVPPAPTLNHFFIGVGAFVGSGIYSKLGFGPYWLFGFVPSRRLSHLHFEFEGAWTSQTSPASTTSESIRMHSIPLVGSLCLERSVIRFCGGLATMIFYSNHLPTNEELLLMFGGNLRVGTELLARGPLSVRADVFGRVAFAQRAFGKSTLALDDPAPFAAGAVVMGTWSID